MDADTDRPGFFSSAAIMRRGLAQSPELVPGLRGLAVVGVMSALGSIVVPILVQQVIDRGGFLDGDINLPTILRLSGLAVIAVIVTQLGGTLGQRWMVIRGQIAIANLRIKVFDHIHRLSLARHTEATTGVLIGRVTSDVDTIKHFLAWALFVWAVSPTILIALFAAMAWYSWPLTLIAFGLMVPAVVTLGLSQRKMGPAYDRRRNAVSSMLGAYTEVLAGAEVVRAYGTHERFFRRLRSANDDRYRAGLAANWYNAVIYVVGDLAATIALALILVVGVTQRDALGLTGGELVGVLLLAAAIQRPLAFGTEVLDESQRAIAGWRKILDLLDTPIEDLEPETGAELDPGPVGIEARGVGFHYGDDVVVLEGVDIDIPAGSRVAIVGETGSGKSTFAKLLCRLADPTEGTIALNGVDIAELSGSARQRAVRLVPQDGFLFDTSIAENIGYGRAGATDAQISQAISQLDLDHWVAALPNGIDTAAGDRGSELSVGERQLVSFARAAVADPGLLILDEATSSVDPQTDVTLTRALDRLAEGRTVVSIAHRLSTAESADLVLVFDAGRLVETGSHDDLRAANGVYARLFAAWERQGVAGP